MYICVDFDGTLVDHKYPFIGSEVPGAFAVLRRLGESGHDLILLTMRSGKYLEEAIKFCEERDIIFTHINQNPSQKSWTSSAKVYASVYIDDCACGTPMIHFPGFDRPCVDWTQIEYALEECGALQVQEHTRVVHNKLQDLEDDKLLLQALLEVGIEQEVYDEAKNLVATWNGLS